MEDLKKKTKREKGDKKEKEKGEKKEKEKDKDKSLRAEYHYNGFFYFFFFFFTFLTSVPTDLFDYPTNFEGQDFLYDFLGQCVTRSFTLAEGSRKVLFLLLLSLLLFSSKNQIFMREELVESKYAFQIASQYLSLALKWESRSVERWAERIKRMSEASHLLMKGDVAVYKSLKERQQRLFYFYFNCFDTLTFFSLCFSSQITGRKEKLFVFAQ